MKITLSKSQWQSIGKQAGWYQGKTGIKPGQDLDKLKGALESLQSPQEVSGHGQDDERGKALQSIPHFFLIYGEPGTGKSNVAYEIAESLGLTLNHIDISHSMRRYVGGTEEMAKNLLRGITSSKDTVWLIDEVDRQVGQTGQEKGQAPHEVSKVQAKTLIDFFENSTSKLYANNVFVVMTTNSIDQVDTATKARSADRYQAGSRELEDKLKMIREYVRR